MVREVIRELQREAEDRPVEWRLGDLPKIYADSMMIRLVFRNLLSNALKYTRGREPALVDVDSKQQGQEVVFAVRDNGGRTWAEGRLNEGAAFYFSLPDGEPQTEED